MLLVYDDIYQNPSSNKKIIKDFFEGKTIKLSRPLSYKGLTLVGISSPQKGDGQRYINLAQGIQSGDIQIREISESGSVPKLAIQNRGNQPLFIMDGEELVGAKQNRITNSSFVIGPNCTTTIPVSCVEQNRWDYNSRNFAASENIIFNKGRKEKFQDIHNSPDYQTDQGKVWGNIHEKMSRLNAHNRTASMHQVYDDQKSTLQDYVSKFKAQENDIGVIYAIGNRIEGVDIFHGTYMFEHYLPKIIKSCVLDILDQKIDQSQIPASKFKKFFDDICHLPVTANKDYFGLGEEYRSKNTDRLKANLVSHHLPVHLLGITVH